MNAELKECKICHKSFNKNNGLPIHLYHSHDISKKEYYDKWIKEEKEGKCQICGDPAKFTNILTHGYRKTCGGKKCSKRIREITSMKKYGVPHPIQNVNIRDKIKLTNLKRYGVENILMDRNKIESSMIKKYGVKNPFELNDVKNKIKITNLKKFGVENVSQSKEIKERKKETCLKNHGVEFGFLQIEKNRNTIKRKYGVNHHLQNIKILKKQKETNLKKFGVENVSQSKEIKERKKETCLKNHGVEYPAQDPSIFEKMFKNSLRLKRYKNTNLTYQGSYEFDFLEKYSSVVKIKNPPSFKYHLNGKIKTYHPDFVIPHLKLIIECKNSYLLKRDKEIIEAKNNSIKNGGYNIIMIIDKNYDKFEKTICGSRNKYKL